MNLCSCGKKLTAVEMSKCDSCSLHSSHELHTYQTCCLIQLSIIQRWILQGEVFVFTAGMCVHQEYWQGYHDQWCYGIWNNSDQCCTSSRTWPFPFPGFLIPTLLLCGLLIETPGRASVTKHHFAEGSFKLKCSPPQSYQCYPFVSVLW
jgi:hypothetical protein